MSLLIKCHFGYRVLISIALGLFTGLFFGPLASVLKPIGDIYIMLLQMVVLPYIAFSVIHGLGSITPETGKKLFLKGWPFLVGLWVLIFVVIYLLSFLIPKPLTVLITAKHVEGAGTLLDKNFLNFLVPENPFYDLANNVVPAIAVFGLITGVSLMHLEKKEPLLSFVERSNQIIEKILKWLAILSPIGIFAHIAVAFGTVQFGDLYKLEFYVVCFILVTLYTTFGILPAIITSLTPLSYTEVLKGFRTVCLLAFAVALPSISFPFLNAYMKKLGEKLQVQDNNFHGTTQTVMPIAYGFGQIGNCLMLFFILFLSFYYRHPFLGSEKALLSLLTIPMSIGSSETSISAVTFLVEHLGFPHDAIDLFIQTMSVTLNFQVLLSVASVLTLIILVLYSYYGLLHIRWKRLCSHLGVSLAIFVLIVAFGRQFIHLGDNYQDLYTKLTIQDVIKNPVHAEFLDDSFSDESEDPLARILRTGVLRVGYDPRNIPYCYYNASKELVGFDVAYAYRLAAELDSSLQFVTIHPDRFNEDLKRGHFDIAMSAILMTEGRLKEMDFTHPYDEENNVLIVPLKKAEEFLDINQVTSRQGLKLGAIGAYNEVVQRHFPSANLLPVETLDSLVRGEIDAWVTSRSLGTIWCVNHPDFVVIDYGDQIGKFYLSYPVKIGISFEWISFLNNWLILKEQSGFKTEMKRYWMEGEPPKKLPPRWSILRDVLHWIN
ncbi:MAG: cation:dicarboxylase symporter family transporter [Verrucomicrobia bacterium]|nr:cation:dicarboxylase symporter family transporter [Verrucomicrobiota bacterium]